jgi:hypothetical protein
MRCANCGHHKCGCTWDEQLAAMRQVEIERRQKIRESGGRPVKIDHQTPYASK